MSDNWIVLIPEDPRQVPSLDLANRACDHFVRIALFAERVEARFFDVLEFVDCGANFESIACPSCDQDISIAWWTDRLDEDRCESGYRLDRYSLPCCGERVTLHQLKYHWPQGFAWFSVEAMNPGIGILDHAH